MLRRGMDPSADRERPIGVFDSGVGGLTVLRALLARLPNESTIYLGDTARVPYGTRSREVVTRYALLCARHLAAQGIKLLVVACNTVSADSLPALAEALPIPVVGVIEAGARAAAARTRGGGIAVLGAPATVASGVPGGPCPGRAARSCHGPRVPAVRTARGGGMGRGRRSPPRRPALHRRSAPLRRGHGAPRLHALSAARRYDRGGGRTRPRDCRRCAGDGRRSCANPRGPRSAPPRRYRRTSHLVHRCARPL